LLAAWFENPFTMLKMPLSRLSRSGLFLFLSLPSARVKRAAERLS
jgi:hypothetical protein